MMLKDKNILLGLTGGIAVYKTVELASRLVKDGANVKVILTENALEFITPMTFRSLTGQSVVTKLFDSESPIEHISLAEWCDLLVIVPATANIIGKISGGIADDLLSTTVMAAASPVMIVPAMNNNMWENPILQENLRKLDKYGYYIMPPDSGRLACGYEGKGRLPDVTEILFYIKSAIYLADRFDNKRRKVHDLSSQKVLITAGACREYLDPMRYLSNESSGRMGLALARTAFHRGAEVTLIAGHVTEQLPYFLKYISALGSKEMYDSALRYAHEMSTIIMSAAVTDFQPERKKSQKIKKEESGNEEFALNLLPTKDILKELGKRKTGSQILVGFAAETEDLVTNARKKLIAKNCDFIAANHISSAGKDENEIILINDSDEIEMKGNKFLLAHRIWDKIKR